MKPPDPVTQRLPFDAPGAERWHRARDVLAVRLDNLGDVLMTSPALAAIRESLPEARLTLLGSPSGVAASPHLPMVDDAIEFSASWVKPMRDDDDGDEAGPGRAERRLIQTLAARRFDAAIVFTTCTQSALPAALLCRLAGIPLRLAHSRENPYALLSDWVPDPDVVETGMRHEVERQLALVARVGLHTRDDRLRFEPGRQARAALPFATQPAGLEPKRRYFVVHPGASAMSRRYPAALFGAAADLVARASGLLPVFSGSAAEEPLVAAARAAMSVPSVSLAGALGLGELGVLIERAEVLIANNSGPVHLAAALATPVVDLYALTNPQHTPWRVRCRVLSHDVPCRHCLKSVCPHGHNDCLRRIEPAAVADAALELLAPTRPAAAGALREPVPAALIGATLGALS
jgi:lipopolysaccharide heptosyltransferase II